MCRHLPTHKKSTLVEEYSTKVVFSASSSDEAAPCGYAFTPYTLLCTHTQAAHHTHLKI